MSIQRVPAVPFAQIANSALRDTRLSFKARGILALVLSNVGDWHASRGWLSDQSDVDGQTAVQSALNELTELGYRRVVKERGPDGQFNTVVLWFQVPEGEVDRQSGNLTDGLSVGEETTRSIEHHSSEHHAEHQSVKNTPALVQSDFPILFERFWTAYPRKKDKGHAKKAWAKAVKTTDPALIIHGAVNFRQWCEQDQIAHQFIPHASTWLNGERWTDERDTVPPTKQDAWIDLFAETVDNSSQGYPQLEG